MRKPLLVLLVVVIALVGAVAATAQYQARRSVVVVGGGVMGGGSYVAHATAGETCVGAMSGLGHTAQAGFWYLPGWVLTGVADESDTVPAAYCLAQNHPNPFNPATTIQFALPERARVTLRLYDAAGREIRTLLDGEMDAGYHRTTIDASELASGVYFCRMVAGRFVETRKLVLLK